MIRDLLRLLAALVQNDSNSWLDNWERGLVKALHNLLTISKVYSRLERSSGGW